MYLLEIENFEKKFDILRNKSKLRKTRYNRVYFNSDLAERETKIQKQIKEIPDMEKKKQKGKIKYQQLIIDNEKWVWNHNKDNWEKVDLQAVKRSKN